jgi:hypothetical protein
VTETVTRRVPHETNTTVSFQSLSFIDVIIFNLLILGAAGSKHILESLEALFTIRRMTWTMNDEGSFRELLLL